MLHKFLLSAYLLAIPMTAHAGVTSGWSGEASVSGSATTGNTETSDIGVAINLGKESGAWKHNFDTTYDMGKAGGVSNKDRWYIGYQIDRKINDRLYGYGNANYFTDDFGSYKQGSFIGGGLGYVLLDGRPANWDVEGGVGYRSQKLRAVGTTPSMKADGFAVRGASMFDLQLNDAVNFYNNSEVIWSDNDTYLWNDIGVTATLAGNLAARFSFRIDHHTDVPATIKKTDTITRAALVYTMK